MSAGLLFSLVIGGKNDNYQMNWIKRLEFTLNYNLFSLNKIGEAHRVEINIVDFCSENRIKDELNIIDTQTNVVFHEISNSNERSPSYHVGLALNHRP